MAAQKYDGYQYGWTFWLAIITATVAMLTSLVSAMSSPPKAHNEDYMGVLTYQTTPTVDSSSSSSSSSFYSTNSYMNFNFAILFNGFPYLLNHYTIRPFLQWIVEESLLIRPLQKWIIWEFVLIRPLQQWIIWEFVLIRQLKQWIIWKSLSCLLNCQRIS